MRQSYFVKLYVGYVLLIGLTVVSISIFIQQAVTRDSLLDIEHSLRQQASLLAEISRAALMGRQAAQLDERLKQLGKETGSRLTVIAPDGTVLADSDEDFAQMDSHGFRPEIMEALSSGTGTATRYSRTLQQNMMYFALRVDGADGAVGFVRTSLPLAVVSHRLEVLRHNVLLGMAVALILSLPLGYLVARRMVMPLAEMTTAAQAIAAGKNQVSIHVGSQDETGKLASALNEMSERLDERLETITRDRNQLQAMLGSMTEGVIAVNQESRIMHLNTSASGLCAVAPDEALGLHTWEALRIPELDKALEQSLAEERAVECDLALAGDRRVYSLTATPWRDSAGNVVGAVIVLHDVSRLRNIEKMRQEFIASASHELKSPLTAIRGFAETIQHDADMSVATRVQFVDSILEECQRLTRLVRDMLALSRAESGVQAEMFAEFDLRAAAADALSLYKKRAEAAGVSISPLLSAGPVMIKGSREALATAIGNLLENAITYTSSGGEIQLKTESLSGKAVVEVKDSGVGISPEHQARLFERFFRVDKARSRELGGTGLGLAIVKHTALSHDGEVGVESRLGHGSTFTIIIPLHNAN